MFFFEDLAAKLSQVICTDHEGALVVVDDAVSRIVQWLKFFHAEGGRLLFVGNGGSAAIASHMAADWTKNGGMRALCFNDGAALTCYGNDLGYDRVFELPIERHATYADTLFAISSSGKSQNILAAVRAGSNRASKIVTLSGFSENNPLRSRGMLNFYVPSSSYGVVEVAHLAICHSIIERAMGAA